MISIFRTSIQAALEGQNELKLSVQFYSKLGRFCSVIQDVLNLIYVSVKFCCFFISPNTTLHALQTPLSGVCWTLSQYRMRLARWSSSFSPSRTSRTCTPSQGMHPYTAWRTARWRWTWSLTWIQNRWDSLAWMQTKQWQRVFWQIIIQLPLPLPKREIFPIKVISISGNYEQKKSIIIITGKIW